MARAIIYKGYELWEDWNHNVGISKGGKRVAIKRTLKAAKQFIDENKLQS